MTFKVRLLLVAVIAMLAIEAQGQKKVQQLQVSKVIPVSADKVWEIVGEDYGKIAHSHPKIMTSDYIGGALKGGEGAERVCYFNRKETRFLKEKMVNYSPETMTFTNKVFQAGRFPVDPDLTQAVYSVEDLGDGTSRFSFDMQYRTKPAFMGGMMKGSFKKLIEDYFIAVEHHAKTGEEVTKENFKKIRKQYVINDELPNAWATALASLSYQ